MIEQLLMADCAVDLPQAVRLQHLVDALRADFGCGAVALLQLEGEHLRPVATSGLVRDALGRRFAIAQHPRLAAILARREVTCFHHDSALPDPYDGLLDARAGEPLPVHDCMGTSLWLEGQVWGVLTLDALTVGTFDTAAQRRLRALGVLVETAIRLSRLETEVRALRLHQGGTGGDGGSGDETEIIGQSEGVARLLHELQVVADTELPVLLLGETGVGKELFAHRLHALSRRRNKPLVHVNCAALPETLAESELFGHVKGAFSGAVGERPGRFEAAHGGTLLLDEVGELPLTVQAKLLRALQNGEIQRLGADRPRKVDVRVIAATNRQLDAQVRNGAFRADLYHRLSVYPLHIPPLRERGADVLLLAGRFLELNRARLGLRSLRLSAAAQQALRRYAWPGNVRELEHVISRAALKALSHGAGRNEIVTLDAELLDLDLEPGTPPAQAAARVEAAPAQHGESAGLRDAGPNGPHGADDAASAETGPALRARVEAVQRQAITQALARHGGRWAAAARELELDPSNLHKLARRLGFKAS